MNFDRRHFIRLASALAASAAAGTTLSSCGGDDDATPVTAGEAGDVVSNTIAGSTAPATTVAVTPETTTLPVAGGTMRVGLLASPSDTLNPATTTGILDYAAMLSLHDSLVLLRGDQFEFQAAESIEPNDDATEWTITVREGVVFHDGQPLTAADVVYSINLIAASPSYGAAYSPVDLVNVVAVDDRTVVVPLKVPRADLVETIFAQLSPVVPDGFTDWGNNIGSGPFKLERYEAGVGVSLVRNADYWNGAPVLERLELVAIADPTAKANALRSGEIDYASGLDATTAASLEGEEGVEVVVGDARNSTIRCFVFNKTQKPFDDPRVIEACKLAIDRQQMIDVITFGNAVLGNDMPSLGFDWYNDEIPQRERDVERATALFAEAGVTEFAIRAADFIGGAVAAAELYVQQLAECGVTATVDVGDPATYFNDFAQVLSTPCQSFYFINRPAITLLGSYTGSGAAFNVLGSGDATYDAALADALATVDEAERGAKVTELLATVFENEGFLIWGFEGQLDAKVTGLEGVTLSQSVPLADRASFV